jgi:hypothetical protein
MAHPDRSWAIAVLLLKGRWRPFFYGGDEDDKKIDITSERKWQRACFRKADDVIDMADGPGERADSVRIMQHGVVLFDHGVVK